MIMRRILMVSVILMAVSVQSEAGFWDKFRGLLWGDNHAHPPKINVLVAHDHPGILLEVKGKYHLYDPNDNSLMGVRYLGKKHVIESSSEGIRWGEGFPGLFQLHIVPANATGTLFIDGKEYQGSVFIYDIGGAVSVVNQVDLENYLISVMGSQFHYSMPEEVLNAVAIAARTNALYEIAHPKNAYWTVDGRRVGYTGVSDRYSDIPIVTAIRETRKLVMSNEAESRDEVLPFPAQWGSITGRQAQQTQTLFSKISLYEAESMADEGANAADILAKAFPHTHIALVP